MSKFRRLSFLLFGLFFSPVFIISGCGKIRWGYDSPSHNPPGHNPPGGAIPPVLSNKYIYADLYLAVMANEVEKVKTICKNQPALGTELGYIHPEPLVSRAATPSANLKDAAIALIDYCDLPTYRGLQNRPLLTQVIYKLDNFPTIIQSFLPVVLKLIEKLPEADLALEDDNQLSALSWAIKIGNKRIMEAILTRVPELGSKKIVKVSGNKREDPFLLAEAAGIDVRDLPRVIRPAAHGVVNPGVGKAHGGPVPVANPIRPAVGVVNPGVGKAHEGPPVANPIRPAVGAPNPGLQGAAPPIVNPPKVIPLSPRQPPKAGFDNQYASRKEINGVVEFSIKQEIVAPVFIKKDGSLYLAKDINEIDFIDFQDVDYVLLPRNHWFARNFVNNPFKDASPKVALARPNIWGFNFEKTKEENNSVLFGKTGYLKNLFLPTIDQAEFDALFPNQKEVGKGGQGVVTKFLHNGMEYALKKNGNEIDNLEKLQFTRAVVEIYGGFQFNGTTYLIMMKGHESLDKKIKRKEKIDNALLLSTLNRFLFLRAAEKKLAITNNDVKPENMILTDDGIKVIDISISQTRGHTGTEGQLMALSLLNAFTGIRIRGGYVDLDRYLTFDVDYIKSHIASPDYFSYWNRHVCDIYKLSDDCSNVDRFDKLFNLLKPDFLLTLGQEINLYWRKAGYRNDESGTNDPKLSHDGYGTSLPFPQQQQPASIKWSDYFDKHNEIANHFCKKVMTSNISKIDKTIGEKYKNNCSIIDKNYVFNLTFDSPDDKSFQDWVMDAFYPIVAELSFKALAFRHPYDTSKIFELILKDKFPMEINVHDSFWNLYKS